MTADHAWRPTPLRLAPILKDKVWGGRRLERFAKPLPDGVMIGESWEVADLDGTSAGGGGGGAARSPIDAGLNAPPGATLRDACAAWGEGMFGRARPAPGGRFPLLVKYLDAREHLSVQVHPSPAYARAHPDAHLKTECWLVLHAEPGSVIYKGLRPGVTPAEFAHALRHTDHGSGVVPLLESVSATPGDLHHLPSGTVHALGAGVLVAEVQTPSDTTFRVYDWALEYDRPERELHIEQALACLGEDPTRPPSPPPAATRLPEDADSGLLLEAEHFTIERRRLAPGAAHAFASIDRPIVVMTLAGGARMTSGDAHIDLHNGATGIIPAACAGAQLSTDTGADLLLAQPT